MEIRGSRQGPQGTLFGTSSLGSAGRFVTPEPGFGGFRGMALGEVSRTRGGGTSWTSLASSHANHLPFPGGRAGNCHGQAHGGDGLR
jgi:hypothetical protein